MLKGIISYQALKERILEIPSHRRIRLDGQINPDKVDSVLRNLSEMNDKSGRTPIGLFINSEGGELDAALALYDALRISSAPIIGVVSRQALSAASIVLQGCAERYSSEHTRIMIHHNTISWRIVEKYGPNFLNHLVKQAEEKEAYMRRQLTRVETIMLGRTRLSKQELEILLEQEPFFTAQEALEKGLLDAVATS